jgi:ferredoxin--NADP+ reductase
MSARPLSVAVVGAGPAGIYAIEHLLGDDGPRDVEVDLYDRLPTPWGLVRSGVAPDHPEKRLVIDRLFAHVLGGPRVRFVGNVNVGVDIEHDALRSAYDAVVYASGATGDTELGIPGEQLQNCVAARAFVGFYNGHPDHRDLDVDLSTDRAVVIGNGNVALDVARILLTPLEELARTDISDVALEKLRASQLREVVVMGRRGPLQAAFANAELEELERLSGVDVLVDGTDLPDDETGYTADPALRRKARTLRRLADRTPTPGNKRIELRFLESPLRFLGESRVEQIEVARNRLVSANDLKSKDEVIAVQGEPEMLPAPGPRPWARAVPTGETHFLDAGLVLRATGYRSSPVPGVPFDHEAGVIHNERGRVTDYDGSRTAGVYVTGWAKRGCRGIIGSNRKDSGETVAHLLEDAVAGRLSPPTATRDDVLRQIHQRVPTVSLSGWSVIDRAERTAGREQGRPRVKVTDRRVQLELAAQTPGGVR